MKNYKEKLEGLTDAINSFCVPKDGNFILPYKSEFRIFDTLQRRESKMIVRAAVPLYVESYSFSLQTEEEDIYKHHYECLLRFLVGGALYNAEKTLPR